MSKIPVFRSGDRCAFSIFEAGTSAKIIGYVQAENAAVVPYMTGNDDVLVIGARLYSAIDVLYGHVDRCGDGKFIKTSRLEKGK